MIDPYFQVQTISATPNPQQTCWMAMHQDYSELFIWDTILHSKLPEENKCGKYVIEHCLSKRHFGVVEHPSITFAVGYFPHAVMQQARTHRVGVSFDCQSMRYTGQRIEELGHSFNKMDDDVKLAKLEELFYLRPIGQYTDRQGAKYWYTNTDRMEDLHYLEKCCVVYLERRKNGMSEEHARDLLPYCIRQHFVVSFNARSLMHFLALRNKKDAQLEIQMLCQLMLPHFQGWMPEIADWYLNEKNFKKVGTISP